MHLLVGNWKMSPEKETQAVELAKKTVAIAKTFKQSINVIVCPPAIHIPSVVKAVKTSLAVGAQGVAPILEMPHTGLLHAGMLKSYGASHCIVGHSESRARGETNDSVALSCLRLLEKKITPIVCIGERNRDVQGWYLSEVKDQLDALFAALPETSLKKIIIAYEPVWAIGKDAAREATPLECEEMTIFIRKMIADHVSEKVAISIPILYGGSVDEHNAKRYIEDANIQGFLIGRVSHEPKRLLALAKAISVK